MQNVIDLLICHFPTLYFQGCAIPYLDPLLEDWGKKTWVKQIVKRVKVIVSFIWQHHLPFTIFCHYETHLILQNPINTWFATNFLMIEWLFKLGLAIEQTIIYPKWTIFVNTLHNTHWQLPHQGKIYTSQHKERWVLGYLCQLCAHREIGSTSIENK